MKSLSPMDQMFLVLERRNQPMHVGGLMLLRPPPGAPSGDIRDMVERMRSFEQPEPPFDQRLSRKLGVPFWTEDEEFDLSHHFRHLALPQPGRIRELPEACKAVGLRRPLLVTDPGLAKLPMIANAMPRSTVSHMETS